MSECRWEWTKPYKDGLWWYGSGSRHDCVPLWIKSIRVSEMGGEGTGWWAYIGPIPPSPLPPKKKVVETMWIRPDFNGLYKGEWFADGEAIQPPDKWIKTHEIRNRFVDE